VFTPTYEIDGEEEERPAAVSGRDRALLMTASLATIMSGPRLITCFLGSKSVDVAPGTGCRWC